VTLCFLFCVSAPPGWLPGGQWNEVFNSDVYDQWFNPNAQGIPGGTNANGLARDGSDF
jgi:1,4-alpha-glucan branching enzyme